MVQGTVEHVETPAPLVCFRRLLGDEALLCIFNLSAEPQELELPFEERLEPAWSHAAQLRDDGGRGQIRLGPCGVLICHMSRPA
ncbi:DUF3459 domain-containing protein [Pseudoroseomonas wenyumeiae]